MRGGGGDGGDLFGGGEWGTALDALTLGGMAGLLAAMAGASLAFGSAGS